MFINSDAHGIVRKQLLEKAVDKGVGRVEVQRIEYPAGQRAPVHSHPCPVVGYVSSGSILFQIEGEPVSVLEAGDAFFEPANKTIVHFDNGSTSEPASFVAFYLLGKSEKNEIRIQK
jgi:quercetin dioxygenase-like cupin family protein